jgi:membrane-associated protein
VLHLVLALLAGGVGLPLPEDVALLSGGYLLWRGLADARELWPAAVAAVVAGDLILYSIGRVAGRTPLLRRWYGEARLARLEAAFARHGARLVLLARFAIGFRAPFFVAAGACRMPLARLIACDLAGASVVVAIWFGVGRRLGPQLHRAQELVAAAGLLLPALAIAVVLALVLRRRGRRTRALE